MPSCPSVNDTWMDTRSNFQNKWLNLLNLFLSQSSIMLRLLFFLTSSYYYYFPSWKKDWLSIFIIAVLHFTWVRSIKRWNMCSPSEMCRVSIYLCIHVHARFFPVLVSYLKHRLLAMLINTKYISTHIFLLWWRGCELRCSVVN